MFHSISRITHGDEMNNVSTTARNMNMQRSIKPECVCDCWDTSNRHQGMVKKTANR